MNRNTRLVVAVRAEHQLQKWLPRRGKHSREGYPIQVEPELRKSYIITNSCPLSHKTKKSREAFE